MTAGLNQHPGNFFWRPRRIFGSVGEWAMARDHGAYLKPLPAPIGDAASDAGMDVNRWSLAELLDGKVVGDARLVATAKNEVLGQLQILHGVAEPATHWAVHQRRLRWTRRLRGTAVLLASAGSGNYYHWLFDSLPRLHLLEEGGIDQKGVDWFLLNEPLHTFDIQSLELLGVPRNRMVRCSKRQIIVADHLLVPPMPCALQGEVLKWVCDFLRESFLPLCPKSGHSPRLYLSRRNVRKRRLANEEEIENLFGDHGFEIFCPENLPFHEQVAAFAQAEAVAGPHGAGFANLVFAPVDTWVLELFHPAHQASNYRTLAGMLGMSYQSVMGEILGGPSPAMSEKIGPYSVNPDRLQAALAAWRSTAM